MLRFLRGADNASVQGPRVRFAIPVLNATLAVFWLAFMLRGLASGWERYLGPSSPDFSLVLEFFPAVVLLSGFGLAAALLWILGNWTLALLSRA